MMCPTVSWCTRKRTDGPGLSGALSPGAGSPGRGAARVWVGERALLRQGEICPPSEARRSHKNLRFRYSSGGGHRGLTRDRTQNENLISLFVRRCAGFQGTSGSQ